MPAVVVTVVEGVEIALSAETVKLFDPYDESQVDLSGIVNAKEQATEPVEDNPGGVG